MSNEGAVMASIQGLFRRLFAHAPQAALGLLGLVLASAGLQAAAILCLTLGASALLAGETATHLLDQPIALGFLLTTLLFMASKFVALSRGSELVEGFANQRYETLIDALSASELPTIEALGRERIRATLTVDLPLIEQYSLLAIHTLQSSTLILACLLLLLALAPAALSILLCAIYLGTRMLNRETTHLAHASRRADQLDLAFTARLSDLLYGFRELKCDPRKATALIDDHLLPASEAARDARVEAGTHYVRKLTLFNWIFLPTLSAIAFILPTYGLQGGVSGAIILAVLWTPFVDLLSGLPNLLNASEALRRVEHLQRDLDARRPASLAPVRPLAAPFASLQMCDMTFHHAASHEHEGFCVGPLDLTLHAGEILFITGGNGSGKSTLMRLICGLYRPDGGQVRVNERATPVEGYRALFSTVLSDYHLFERLYSERPPEPERVTALLAELALADKTHFSGDAFAHHDLSSGQRRRLALTQVLLEDRPIYLFDEWTADQDPGFRVYFYDQLLPRLKRAGKGVICVTHDERFFDRADRVLRLRDGRFEPEVAA